MGGTSPSQVTSLSAQLLQSAGRREEVGDEVIFSLGVCGLDLRRCLCVRVCMHE